MHPSGSVVHEERAVETRDLSSRKRADPSGDVCHHVSGFLEPSHVACYVKSAVIDLHYGLTPLTPPGKLSTHRFCELIGLDTSS